MDSQCLNQDFSHKSLKCKSKVLSLESTSSVTVAENYLEHLKLQLRGSVYQSVQGKVWKNWDR
jgi:hypothetical protein